MISVIKRRDFLRLSAIAAIEAGLFSIGFPRSSLAGAPAKEGLAYLTAVEQIQYFREGALSPVDVLTAHRFGQDAIDHRCEMLEAIHPC